MDLEKFKTYSFRGVYFTFFDDPLFERTWLSPMEEHLSILRELYLFRQLSPDSDDQEIEEYYSVLADFHRTFLMFYLERIGKPTLLYKRRLFALSTAFFNIVKAFNKDKAVEFSTELHTKIFKEDLVQIRKSLLYLETEPIFPENTDIIDAEPKSTLDPSPTDFIIEVELEKPTSLDREPSEVDVESESEASDSPSDSDDSWNGCS